jgi:hypothetical protein
MTFIKYFTMNNSAKFYQNMVGTLKIYLNRNDKRFFFTTGTLKKFFSWNFSISSPVCFCKNYLVIVIRKMNSKYKMKTKIPLSKRKKYKGFIKGIRDHHKPK